MTTIVTRSGKGSALTHNEVDSNFTNLNNDKLETSRFPNVNSNVTSSDEELNLLDGVTATTDELNKTDDSAAAVAGYVSGMRTYIYADGLPGLGIAINPLMAESTFESFGPTGSGATNIWAAMNAIPAGARIAIVRVRMSGSPTSADTNTSYTCYVRQTGGSVAVGDDTILVHRQDATDDNVAGFNFLDSWAFIPLDSSRRFDAAYASSNLDSISVIFYLKGFIV